MDCRHAFSIPVNWSCVLTRAWSFYERACLEFEQGILAFGIYTHHQFAEVKFCSRKRPKRALIEDGNPGNTIVVYKYVRLEKWYGSKLQQIFSAKKARFGLACKAEKKHNCACAPSVGRPERRCVKHLLAKWRTVWKKWIIYGFA